MAIVFIVEDGTGKSDSTSYLTTADFLQYWENKGVDYSGKTSDELQVALNIGTEYLDNYANYKGAIVIQTQALQFPRYYIFNRNGVDLSSTVPQAVKNAVCEFAAYSFTKELTPVQSNIASRSMGSLSVSYGEGGQVPPEIISGTKYIGDLIEPNLQVVR